MEKNEISIHGIKVFKAIKDAGKWVSNLEIASAIDGVSNRTIRAHTLRLVQMGRLDQAEVFPSHRYRLAEKPTRGTVPISSGSPRLPKLSAWCSSGGGLVFYPFDSI
jgi:hypothetical protein